MERAIVQRITLRQDEVVAVTFLLQEGNQVYNELRCPRLRRSHTVICRLRNRPSQFDTVTKRPYPSRERIATPWKNLSLIRTALHNTAPQEKYVNIYLAATGSRISTQTVRNRVHESNLLSKVRSVRLQLIREHKRLERSEIIWI